MRKSLSAQFKAILWIHNSTARILLTFRLKSLYYRICTIRCSEAFFMKKNWFVFDAGWADQKKKKKDFKANNRPSHGLLKQQLYPRIFFHCILCVIKSSSRYYALRTVLIFKISFIYVSFLKENTALSRKLPLFEHHEIKSVSLFDLLMNVNI